MHVYWNPYTDHDFDICPNRILSTCGSFGAVILFCRFRDGCTLGYMHDEKGSEDAAWSSYSSQSIRDAVKVSVKSKTSHGSRMRILVVAIKQSLIPPQYGPTMHYIDCSSSSVSGEV